jgi:hypothetical protein
MSKWRKKPVVIEAIKYLGGGNTEKGETPEWMWDALKTNVAFNRGNELFISTLEGEHHVSAGDYIIKGIKGELYPCKPDIFAATYERVDG